MRDWLHKTRAARVRGRRWHPEGFRSADGENYLGCSWIEPGVISFPSHSITRGPRLLIVQTCPSCGRDNPDLARFCLACGTPLPETAARDVRKTVTILFSDVVGSTELGEKLDPESLRQVMGRYFREMKAVVERISVIASTHKEYGHPIDLSLALEPYYEDAAHEMESALPVPERIPWIS